MPLQLCAPKRRTSFWGQSSDYVPTCRIELNDLFPCSSRQPMPLPYKRRSPARMPSRFDSLVDASLATQAPVAVRQSGPLVLPQRRRILRAVPHIQALLQRLLHTTHRAHETTIRMCSVSRRDARVARKGPVRHAVPSYTVVCSHGQRCWGTP